jgi:hypothetical protein
MSEKGFFGELLLPHKDLKRDDLWEIRRLLHEVITPPSVDVSRMFLACQKLSFTAVTVQDVPRLMLADYDALIKFMNGEKEAVSPSEFYKAVEGSGLRNYARLLRILDIQITTMSKTALRRFVIVAKRLQTMNEIRVPESFKNEPFDLNNVDPQLLVLLNIRVSERGGKLGWKLTITDRFKLGAVFHCSIYDDCQCKFCRSFDGNRRGVISLEQVADKLGVSMDVLMMLNENGAVITFMEENDDVLSEDNMDEIKDLLYEKLASENELQHLNRKYRITDKVFLLLGIELIAVHNQFHLLKKDFKRLSHVASFVVKNARRWDTSSFMANLDGDVLVLFGIQSSLTSEDYRRIAEIVKILLPTAKISIPGEVVELTEEDLAEFDSVVKLPHNEKTTKKRSKKVKPLAVVATTTVDDDADGDEGDDLRRIVLKKEHVAPSVLMGPRIIQGVSRGPGIGPKNPPTKIPDVKVPTKTALVAPKPLTKTAVIAPKAPVSDPFECSICFERFTCDGDHLPCSLSCGHSICISHVKALSNCPICRQSIDKTTAPRPNFSLRDVLVLLNKDRSPLP